MPESCFLAGHSSFQKKFNFELSSRTEEKRQLGFLNDRLAAYIDRVRSLELENNTLNRKVRFFCSS